MGSPRGNATHPLPPPLDAGPTGQGKDGAIQLAPGGLDCQEVHESGPELPRPDSGRKPWPDSGSRKVRPRKGLQVLHLRHLVDSSGNHPSHCRPEPHHPTAGAPLRNDLQDQENHQGSLSGIRPEANGRGNRRIDGNDHRKTALHRQECPAADLPGDPNRQGRGFPPGRFHRSRHRESRAGRCQEPAS